MGMALDELKANDKKIEVEGFSFIMASEVADTIRSHGDLFIDCMEQSSEMGFQLSFKGQPCC